MPSLRTIYETLSSPGSLTTADKLYKEARRRGVKTTKLKVQQWLSKELSYTLHKPIRKKFPRNKTIVFYIDELWQMDLCDMASLKQYNDECTFLLTVIDVFSKKGFARVLKNKQAKTVLHAFLDILKTSHRVPSKVQTDAGVEFLNRYFKNELKKETSHIIKHTVKIKQQYVKDGIEL